VIDHRSIDLDPGLPFLYYEQNHPAIFVALGSPIHDADLGTGIGPGVLVAVEGRVIGEQGIGCDCE
jgi:hypothetical protein